MEYKSILLTKEEEIATITFNRPKVLNAMNSEVLGEIYDAVTICAKDGSVKALILTGPEARLSWPERIFCKCKIPHPWKFCN